jgi:hypothetical protein
MNLQMVVWIGQVGSIGQTGKKKSLLSYLLISGSCISLCSVRFLGKLKLAHGASSESYMVVLSVSL